MCKNNYFYIITAIVNKEINQLSYAISKINTRYYIYNLFLLVVNI